MSFFATYPALSGGGGGGGGITSINGDTTAAQFIASGTGISVNSVANTHTINSTVSYGNLTDVGTDGITITGGTGAVVGAGTSISQHVADSTHNGYLSSTDWSTFNAKQAALTIGNLTDVGTDGITITGGTGSVIGSGTSISQQVADSTHNGYLSSTDWSTFNGKQAALTIGNLTDVGTDGITITGGTGSVIGSGTSISQQVANGSQNGYLSSTDWTTFNSKQAAGSYITALTGDVTATGPGSVAATIANLAVTNSKIANSTIDLTAKVTGALPIANGGTGQTTANPAFNALSPLTTKGDLVGFSTVNARVPVGTDGQVLVADSGTAVGVSWTTNSPTVTGNVRATEGAGTTTLVSSDNHIQIFDLSAARNVDLPSTGVAKGQVWTLENTTNFDLTIRAADSNPILYSTAFTGSQGDAVIQIGQVILEAMVATPATPADWRVVSVYESYGAITGISLGGALAGATATLVLERNNKVVTGYFSSDTVTATATLNATIPTSTFPTRFCYTGGGPNQSCMSIYGGGIEIAGILKVSSDGSAVVTKFDASNWASGSGLTAGGGYHTTFTTYLNL